MHTTETTISITGIDKQGNPSLSETIKVMQEVNLCLVGRRFIMVEPVAGAAVCQFSEFDMSASTERDIFDAIDSVKEELDLNCQAKVTNELYPEPDFFWPY